MPDFRDAAPADAEALVALIESAYRGEESRLGWTSEADLVGGTRTDEDAVAAAITDPQVLFLVLEEAGELIACCQLSDRADGLAHFGSFAVRPRRQGGGIGRRVLAEAERRARTDLGATAVEMTVVDRRDALIAWYERLGYARTGETRPFPYPTLVGRLRFVVLRKALGDA